MKFVALLALLLAGAIAMGAPGGLASATAVRASKVEGNSAAEQLGGDLRRRLAATGECTSYDLIECCCDGDETDNDGEDTDADCSCVCPPACPAGRARARNFDDNGNGDDGDD